MSVKVDFALTKNKDGIYDKTIGADGDFATVGGFDTTIMNRLFTKKRADESINIPGADRSGWFGNAYIQDIYQFGSLLWLKKQSRNTNETKNDIVAYCQDALASLVPKYAREVEVTGQISGAGDDITINIKITYDNENTESFSFDFWEETGVNQ